MQLSNEFKNKRILVWGYGLEGKSTVEYIHAVFPEQHITITDTQAHTFTQDYLTFVSLENCVFDHYDIIMKSPGIVIEDPQFPWSKLSSQAQLFLKYYKHQIVGITGTKGKSTTSSLLAHVLRLQYPSVFLVGNIGIPCFDVVLKMNSESIIVFELSCHQLEYATSSPHIGVLLNLFEEHLDHYGTFDKYCRAKENIFLHQTSDDVAILNSSCSLQLELAKNGIVASIDSSGEIFAEGNKLVAQGYECVILDDETSLIGHHNFYNMAIVYYIAKVCYKVSDELFKEACRSFNTLSHRLQNIGVFDGVRYIDDSISTICQSTIQAIHSLCDVDTVLLGGMDRGIDYDELLDFLILNDVHHVIFMYASGKRMFEIWKEKTNKEAMWVNDLKEAVHFAKIVTEKGKSCLLSPASASYGYFKNFEERGDVFQELVKTNEI